MVKKIFGQEYFCKFHVIFALKSAENRAKPSFVVEKSSTKMIFAKIFVGENFWSRKFLVKKSVRPKIFAKIIFGPKVLYTDML